MAHHDYAGSRRDAIITFALVALAVAAFDDITTDNARSFPLERTMLACWTVWCLVVAWRLWRSGARVLGALSFGLVAAAALAQPLLGPGIAPTQVGSLATVAYLATLGALVWFLLMAGVLAGFAWRRKHSHA